MAALGGRGVFGPRPPPFPPLGASRRRGPAEGPSERTHGGRWAAGCAPRGLLGRAPSCCSASAPLDMVAPGSLGSRLGAVFPFLLVLVDLQYEGESRPAPGRAPGPLAGRERRTEWEPRDWAPGGEGGTGGGRARAEDRTTGGPRGWDGGLGRPRGGITAAGTGRVQVGLSGQTARPWSQRPTSGARLRLPPGEVHAGLAAPKLRGSVLWFCSSQHGVIQLFFFFF